MPAIISNTKLLETLLLSGSASQELPIYAILLSLMYLFVMLPIILFPKSDETGKKDESNNKFVKQKNGLEYIFQQKNDTSKDFILIVRQKNDYKKLRRNNS